MANDAPRRTPPPIDPDFYGWFTTLTEEESATRLAVRRVMEEVVAPVVNQCWQAEEFPHALRDAFSGMDLLDGWYHDVPGPPAVARAVISMEMARVDPGSASVIAVLWSKQS